MIIERAKNGYVVTSHNPEVDGFRQAWFMDGSAIRGLVRIFGGATALTTHVVNGRAQRYNPDALKAVANRIDY